MFAQLRQSGGSGRISTRSDISRIIPKASEISMGSETSTRSIAEILQVVRARTPGLRHIYNKYLRQTPGINGKVTLRFTILAGGDIVQCSIQSSTTGTEAFDEEIRSTVELWKFKVIRSGNTTVAIPFQFSE